MPNVWLYIPEASTVESPVSTHPSTNINHVSSSTNPNPHGYDQTRSHGGIANGGEDGAARKPSQSTTAFPSQRPQDEEPEDTDKAAGHGWGAVRNRAKGVIKTKLPNNGSSSSGSGFTRDSTPSSLAVPSSGPSAKAPGSSSAVHVKSGGQAHGPAKLSASDDGGHMHTEADGDYSAKSPKVVPPSQRAGGGGSDGPYAPEGKNHRRGGEGFQGEDNNWVEEHAIRHREGTGQGVGPQPDGGGLTTRSTATTGPHQDTGDEFANRQRKKQPSPTSPTYSNTQEIAERTTVRGFQENDRRGATRVPGALQQAHEGARTPNGTGTATSTSRFTTPRKATKRGRGSDLQPPCHPRKPDPSGPNQSDGGQGQKPRVGPEAHDGAEGGCSQLHAGANVARTRGGVDGRDGGPGPESHRGGLLADDTMENAKQEGTSGNGEPNDAGAAALDPSGGEVPRPKQPLVTSPAAGNGQGEPDQILNWMGGTSTDHPTNTSLGLNDTYGWNFNFTIRGQDIGRTEVAHIFGWGSGGLVILLGLLGGAIAYCRHVNKSRKKWKKRSYLHEQEYIASLRRLGDRDPLHRVEVTTIDSGSTNTITNPLYQEDGDLDARIRDAWRAREAYLSDSCTVPYQKASKQCNKHLKPAPPCPPPPPTPLVPPPATPTPLREKQEPSHQSQLYMTMKPKKNHKLPKPIAPSTTDLHTFKPQAQPDPPPPPPMLPPLLARSPSDDAELHRAGLQRALITSWNGSPPQNQRNDIYDKPHYFGVEARPGWTAPSQYANVNTPHYVNCNVATSENMVESDGETFKTINLL